MRRILAVAAVVATMLSTTAPARAAAIWQETFAPDPSGQTSESLWLSFPMAAPTTKALLTVHGGALADIGWSSLAYFGIYVWYELPPNSGNWFLTEDILPGGTGQEIEAIHTTTAYSTYRIDTNSYYTCYGSGFHSEAVCGSVFQYGTAGLDGMLVNATRPFTLTLYTSVPEPSSWAMMLGGFALLGLALRRLRSGVCLASS